MHPSPTSTESQSPGNIFDLNELVDVFLHSITNYLKLNRTKPSSETVQSYTTSWVSSYIKLQIVRYCQRSLKCPSSGFNVLESDQNGNKS
jgi:hypothetical protein